MRSQLFWACYAGIALGAVATVDFRLDYLSARGDIDPSYAMMAWLLLPLVILAGITWLTQRSTQQVGYALAQLVTVLGTIAVTVFTYYSLSAAPFREGSTIVYLFNPLLVIILGSILQGLTFLVTMLVTRH